ncbi:hypothetical protein ABGT15_07620 [Flavobacterium enshiense]|uniref:hypothetical protein n=1 Tax=Flavobacterium enshiense TaxID=1341165 RepID=UPI00345DA0CC
MEQEKLYHQIKKAAENAEFQDFPAMDKVWNRVESKLDQKLLKKENSRWKKIAVAASVLLTVTTVYLFFKWNNAIGTQEKNIVVQDSVVKTPLKEENKEAVALHPELKPETEQLINDQVRKQTETVVSTYVPREKISEVTPTEAPIMSETIIEKDKTGKLLKPRPETISVVPKQNSTGTTFRTDQDFSTTTAKSVQQKDKPLVVVNGKAVTGKEYNLNGEDVESVVVLDDPLYIINGTYYTEQQLFGPNPTSPYAPLDKQEIETVSVLQGKKATDIYGDKGKKGVVIIATKNGKPAKLFERKK